MVVLSIFTFFLVLAGSYIFYFVAPKKGPDFWAGVPFKHTKSSPIVWNRSNRVAGICLFLSSFFVILPIFIWGRGNVIIIFVLALWAIVILPLMVIIIYAYSLLLLKDLDKS